MVPKEGIEPSLGGSEPPVFPLYDFGSSSSFCAAEWAILRFRRESEGNGRRRGFVTTRSAVLPLDESRLRHGPGVEPGWADGNGVVTAFAASFVRVTGGS